MHLEGQSGQDLGSEKNRSSSSRTNITIIEELTRQSRKNRSDLLDRAQKYGIRSRSYQIRFTAYRK